MNKILFFFFHFTPLKINDTHTYNVFIPTKTIEILNFHVVVFFQYNLSGGRVQRCCSFVSASAYRTFDLHVFIFIYETRMHLSRSRLGPGSLPPGNSYMEPPSRNGQQLDGAVSMGSVC